MAERIEEQVAHRRVQSYMVRVFSWMSGALGLTGITAYTVSSIDVISQAIVQNPGIILALFLAQLGIVIALSYGVTRLSFETASLLFWGYALLTGVTLSGIFLVYTAQSIASVFFIAAAMFGFMAIYGSTTDADLTSMGSYLYMGLFGLIIAQVVNWFIGSSALDLGLSLIGVIIFSGLTAYDVQILQRVAYQLDQQEADTGKITIIMALKLYLDFLNLFLYLLRLLGTRRR